VAATKTGWCHHDQLVVYQATDAGYTSQTLVAKSNGSPLTLPCGYWQADFVTGPTKSHLGAAQPNLARAHKLLAWRRGNHSCTAASTTTSTTTTPPTTSTTSSTSTTDGTSTTSTTLPPHPGGKTHKVDPTPSATTTTTVVGVPTTPAGHLAFTGSSAGSEALVAAVLLSTGAVLCGIARYRKGHRTASH
jgi:hypothetical protein